MSRIVLVAALMSAATAMLSTATVAQDSTAILFGAVIDSATGLPIVEVAVYVDGTTLANTTDSAGEFLLNGLRPGGHFAYVMKTGYAPDTIQFTLPANLAGQIDAGVVVLTSGPPPYATLVGTVVDAQTRQPVPGTSVALNGQIGVATDTAGTFHIPTVQVKWGVNLLEFQRVGYAPMSTELWVAEQQTDLDLDVALTAAAVPLTEVLVEGERRSLPARLAGFTGRREKGIGEFLTEEDWEEFPDFRVAQVLHRMHGVTVAGWRVLMSNAPFTCRKRGISARIWVNGASVNKEFIQDMNIDDVLAIEVYRRIADIPIQYNSSADQPRAFGGGPGDTSAACGVVLIWTR